MQKPETMSRMMKDLIQYIMMPKIRYAPGIGTYVSYDIAAYDCFEQDIVAIAWDVTADRNTALRIVGKFNRYQLAPCHLLDAIFDLLPINDSSLPTLWYLVLFYSLSSWKSLLQTYVKLSLLYILCTPARPLPFVIFLKMTYRVI